MRRIETRIKEIISIYLNKDLWNSEDVWEDLVEEFPWFSEVDDETHTIEVHEDRSYVVQHPLSERLKGTLFECDFRLKYEYYQPGVYQE